MGYGDDIMATGMARGASDRGKRIAFGDGRRIIWGPWSAEIFRDNPNVAAPGSEGATDLEWIAHHKGHRLYNRLGVGRWVWNMAFRAIPGEIFFGATERAFVPMAPGFVLIEPNVPPQKSVAANKQWPVARFQLVADALRARGHRVVQLRYGARHTLGRVDTVATRTFREALAVLSRAGLYIGPEGGMHHGAAAVGVPAVVLFGGFIPPSVTGYAGHVNLTGGAQACGSLKSCEHCRAALDRITVEDVLAGARGLL